MEQSVEGELCDWDENVSIALAILAVQRVIYGEDPESEKYRSGQKIIAGLVARTLSKENNDVTEN